MVAVAEQPMIKLEAGELLELVDWTSGDNLIVVDVVSPFNPAEVFEKRFLAGAQGTGLDGGDER